MDANPNVNSISQQKHQTPSTKHPTTTFLVRMLGGDVKTIISEKLLMVQVLFMYGVL